MARLVAGCTALVDIATPTGDERPAAACAAGLLHERGLDARLDHLDERSANAWAHIRARGPRAGTAPTLLLYSPLDTVTTGDARDLPHVADEIDGHLLARAETIEVDGDTIIRGLGAQNPKGHAASLIEAAAILAAAEELPGDIVIGLGAGGMPTDPVDPETDPRPMTGHGVGVAHLLGALDEAGAAPAAAVIAKSGWFVQNDEVGLAWIDVIVRGDHCYVGARHRLPYRSAIADAARIVLALEAEFADSSDRAVGTLEPQAMVASVHGGWARMSAFSPASTHIGCDVRLLPNETGVDALCRIDAVLDRLRADDPDLDATARIRREIAGSVTDVDHPICVAARRAWEAIEGRPHETPSGQSGSTDANIIRQAGVPTARVGLPKVHLDGAELGFAEGMNTVTASSMRRLTELLIHTVDRFHTAHADTAHADTAERQADTNESTVSR